MELVAIRRCDIKLSSIPVSKTLAMINKCVHYLALVDSMIIVIFNQWKPAIKNVGFIVTTSHENQEINSIKVIKISNKTEHDNIVALSKISVKVTFTTFVLL